MKIWLICYAFFLGFISLAIAGHASPGKEIGKYSAMGISPQNDRILDFEKNHILGNDPIVLNHRTRTAAPLSALSAVRDNCVLAGYDHSFALEAAWTSSEKLLYNYLLHLFPSHYFW